MGSRVRQVLRQVMVEFELSQSPMMAVATPVYDPENIVWSSERHAAYESATGAISATIVPLLVESMGTATPRLAWHAFASGHPLEAGVITAHVLAESSDPLQALYHLIERRVASGYWTLRHGTYPGLKVVVTCPSCRSVFEPWGHIQTG